MAHTADNVLLQYGESGLPLDIRGLNATLLRPQYDPGIPTPQETFQEALRYPISSAPLRDIVQPKETVAIAIPDITRALPSHLLLPWLFDELSHVPRDNFVIVVGTGTHRANTREELCRMVGEDVVRTVRIVNHDARNYAAMTRVGHSPYGYDVHFNTAYVKADRRILMGFIEPHFMAGFSGGYKAAFPGVADMNAILQYHGFNNIAHAHSTWGTLEGNPTQAHIRAAGALMPADFLINVTLNDTQDITAFFCGDIIDAHQAGCAYSQHSAMAHVDRAFPIVVTTNSGFPLDLNLYQSVKGMCAAAPVVTGGGLIIAAARCNDGFPSHGTFKEQLLRWASPREGLKTICQARFAEADQWQTQKLFQTLLHCRVQLYSELDADEVQRAHIGPVADVRKAIDAELNRLGDMHAPVAIMPEGPLTIPYLQ